MVENETRSHQWQSLGHLPCSQLGARSRLAPTMHLQPWWRRDIVVCVPKMMTGKQKRHGHQEQVLAGCKSCAPVKQATTAFLHITIGSQCKSIHACAGGSAEQSSVCSSLLLAAPIVCVLATKIGTVVRAGNIPKGPLPRTFFGRK